MTPAGRDGKTEVFGLTWAMHRIDSPPDPRSEAASRLRDGGVRAGRPKGFVMDDAQLRTVWQQRQFNDRFAPLAEPLGYLMKYTLGRKVRQIGKLATIWDEVIPDGIREHTALESFNRGTLTVMVDSSPHRCQLQMLLTAGLLKEIQARFPGALNRIRLVPGQFASVDVSGSKRYEF